MSNERELDELRQFRHDAVFLEIDLRCSHETIAELRDEYAIAFNEMDPAKTTERAYLYGVIRGFDLALKELASPIDFGKRWIRPPEPKVPHLKLVVDNRKNRLAACNDQTV